MHCSSSIGDCSRRQCDNALAGAAVVGFVSYLIRCHHHISIASICSHDKTLIFNEISAVFCDDSTTVLLATCTKIKCMCTCITHGKKYETIEAKKNK